MKINPKKTLRLKGFDSLLKKSLISFMCLLLVSIANVHAQTRTLTGTVTDTFNESLIGVNISVQGKTTGAITDIDGKFSLSVTPEDVLIVSYVGMKAQQITVGSQTSLLIVMEEDATMLAETIVIGYGSAKKRDLTGSIVSIKAEEIANRPSANPLASLQGKIAGVQVVNTGRAGQDPEIRIRGTNSLNGYTPLYIVDGLFSDNINYLNPADIESIEILKDPSSLAIFGVRGANGVIIVTTKRAKEGQTVVNINSSIGWKRIEDRVSLTNAEQFKELYNEQRTNQGQNPFDYTNWQADTNWQDEIFQTGFMTNNNVSITGSGDKNKFYLGVGYTSEEGSIKSEEFSKVTLNLSSDYKVTNSIRFGFQVNGARSLPPDAKGVGSALRAAPIAPIYADYTNMAGVTESLLHTLPDFQRAQVWNPMIAIDLQGDHNKAVNYRAAGNIYGEVDLMKSLTFKATFSLDYATGDSRQYSPLVNVYNPDIKDAEILDEFQRITQSKNNRVIAQQDYILTYADRFGLHGLNVMAGLTTNYREYSSLTGGRSQKFGSYDFSIPNNNPDKWWLTSIGDASSATNGGSQYRRFTMSYLLRGLYNYNNRYLLNASYRRDGSSVFRNTGNTWDNFYSLGTGWIASDEAFMANQDVINYLKLKASWGVLGSENTGGSNYPSFPGMVSSGSAVFGDNILTGYTEQYLVQNIGWEKTYSWEAGFETLLLNNRLRLEPVYYKKNTKDILVTTESIGGAQNQMQNLGEVQNSGLELSVSWNDKIGESGFRYSIGSNVTTINNKVLKIDVEDTAAKLENGISRTIKGEPIGYFYGYKVIGVYQNNEHIKQSPANKLATVKPGDLIFEDIDDDGEITDKDRTRIGNPTPDLTYGFNVNLYYKNFDLGIDMMGVYGNEIFRNWDSSAYAQFNYMSNRMDRWNGEGTSNWEPILDPAHAINLLPSSYFIEDGSFFRIRNLQLGYTFESSVLRKIGLSSLRAYVNAQNLKTWSKNSGYTPEIGGGALSFGIDSGSYPLPAIYTFGLNLTF